MTLEAARRRALAVKGHALKRAQDRIVSLLLVWVGAGLVAWGLAMLDAPAGYWVIAAGLWAFASGRQGSPL